jgi:ABC-2 type transport system ATP-binding protein
VGVDPQSRVRLLELVREEARGGICVLYTTHYMEEAEDLCDRLAIVDHGKCIAEGTLDELRAKVGGRDLLRLTGRFEPERARDALASVEGAELVHCEETLITLAVSEGPRRLPAVIQALDGVGSELTETTLTRPSLESLFIELTGKELRDK